MTSAVKSSKSEQAYEYLREKIRTREYEPGFRLVLSSLAEELGMSVVPVREAIRQLEAEQLVSYETNVGARVSTVNRESYFSTMETVALLEGAATAQSVPYLTKADLARASAINDEMIILLDEFDALRFTELNKQFHQVLFEPCPNRRLVDLVTNEWDRLDHFRVSTFRYIPRRARESVAEHQQLLDLIAAGAEEAYIEKAAREHRLRTSRKYHRLFRTTTTKEENQ